MSYNFFSRIYSFRDLYDLHMMEDPNPIIYHIYGGWVCFIFSMQSWAHGSVGFLCCDGAWSNKKNLAKAHFSNPILGDPNGISNFM